MSRRQKMGLKYETDFGDWLESRLAPGETLHRGPWLQFSDANGPGHARPDFVRVSPSKVSIFECKLVFRYWAWEQVCGLYAPLVEEIWPGPQARFVVCQAIYGAIPAPPKPCALVHWLGKTDPPTEVNIGA